MTSPTKHEIKYNISFLILYHDISGQLNNKCVVDKIKLEEFSDLTLFQSNVYLEDWHNWMQSKPILPIKIGCFSLFLFLEIPLSILIINLMGNLIFSFS